MARILVIDDDEIVRAMIIQLLSEDGHEAVGANDGRRGLRLLEEKSFDLIITDIVMPEKEGIETIREIRKKNLAVPIIAISGGGKIGPEQYLRMAMELGANHAFQKPFNNESFLLTVRECLAGT